MDRLFFLLCGLAMMSCASASVVFAAACPTLCGAFVTAGVAGLAAALSSLGVGVSLSWQLVWAVHKTTGLASCTAACSALFTGMSCFDQYAHVDISQNGDITNIPMHLLQAGDVVRSVNEISTGIQIFARVNHTSKIYGNFLFFQIDFDNERQTAINVTAPHLMILCEKGKDSLGAKAARNVTAGDAMVVTDFDGYGNVNERCTYVKNVTPFYASEKINVETDTGTIIANDVFVTGICENIKFDHSGDVVDVLSEYRRYHN